MNGLGRRLTEAAQRLAQPLLERLPPADLHSEGAREARLSGHPVRYTLRRSNRRTIGFAIDHRGLTVSAPRWVSQREIDSALATRGDWVLRKLTEWREVEARRVQHEVHWAHGAEFPFLGRPLTLHVETAHRGPARRIDDRLHVALPSGAGGEQLRETVHAWIQSQARAHYALRIAHFSDRLGVAPKRWRLSSARTRWGSCSADGSIRLNWRLMHFPPEIVDYVVCHELAHLKELNHGPRFWSTVGELFPEYPRARAWLKSAPVIDRGRPPSP